MAHHSNPGIPGRDSTATEGTVNNHAAQSGTIYVSSGANQGSYIELKKLGSLYCVLSRLSYKSVYFFLM